MKARGWRDHPTMHTHIVLVEAEYADGSYDVAVPTEYDEGYGFLWERRRVAAGVKPPVSFAFPDEIADALRDALVDANGAPSQDERIAALEAEVSVLREWLRSCGALPPPIS